jgi:hypothetical protein
VNKDRVIRSTGWIALSVFVAVTFTAVWASRAEAGIPLDQYNEGPRSGGLNIVTNQPIGQEFISPHDSLAAVELNISGNFGVAGDCTVTVDIRHETISGPILGSASTAAVEQNSPPEWRLFEFVPPVTMIPGQTYVIAINSTTATCGASTSAGNPYAPGSGISNGTVSTSGLDLLFRTYAETVATPSPTPSPTPNPGQNGIWGDSNCSGSADPIDSLLTLRFDAGLPTSTNGCPEFGETVDVADASLHLWGDADCSGAPDPVDSLKLLRFDAGLDASQAEDCPAFGSAITFTPPATPTSTASPSPTPTDTPTPTSTPSPSPTLSPTPVPCTVGVNCCVGVDACTGFTGNVGFGSCMGEKACFNASGDVGAGSCVSNEACLENTGKIGDGSCLESWACKQNIGNVGNGSCIGPVSCYRNSGNLGDGKCLGFDVCNNNTLDMP